MRLKKALKSKVTHSKPKKASKPSIVSANRVKSHNQSVINPNPIAKKTLFQDGKRKNHTRALSDHKGIDEMNTDEYDLQSDDLSNGHLTDKDLEKETGDENETHTNKKARTEDSAPNDTSKTESEANKPSRDMQKRLLQERKAQKPHADLISAAKKLWEEIRRKDIKPSKRAQAMEELLKVVKGSIQDLIFKHDCSRVVQSMLKYGSSAQRDSIAAELKGAYVQLSKNQYSRFLVSKILAYCPKHRDAVMKEFHGKVRKLMRQKSASLIIDEAYTIYANATQKSQLIEEFYGPQYALFKGTGGSSLSELIKESPAKKPHIIKHLRETLDGIIDKGNADIGPHNIIHRLILEYLNHADTSDKVSLVEPLKDQIVRILHTKDGSRASQILYAHATAKDRKHIIKSMKSYMLKIAKEQYGSRVLMFFLECTDDTVLSGKACVGELVANTNQLKECCMDQFASRIILHALVGRKKKYLTPVVVSDLSSLDAGTLSKKDSALKHSEILAFWKQPLKDVVMNNFEELIKDKFGSCVVAEVLRVLGDEELFSKLAESLSKPPSSRSNHSINDNDNARVDDEEFFSGTDSESVYQTAGETPQKQPFHPIKALSAKLEKPIIKNKEHVLVNRTSNTILKELITSGRRFAVTEKPPLAPDTEMASKFSDTIALALQPSIQQWLKYCSQDVNHSSGIVFVLVGLIECGSEKARDIVINEMKAFGVDDLNKEVEKQTKKDETDEKQKRQKNGKRKRNLLNGESKEQRMPGLQVLLHRYKELVA